MGKICERDRRPHIVLTSNGPGELSGWVCPMVKEINRRKMDWTVSVVLWPFLYASGREDLIARQLGGVDRVIGPESSTKLVWGAGIPHEWMLPRRPQALLHLGGSALMSIMLAKRMKCPAFAYAERPMGLPKYGFRKVFLSDAAAAGTAGFNPRFQVTGNLFADAVSRIKKTTATNHASKESLITIGFFPGSRLFMVKNMLPFFLKVAAEVAIRVRAARFLVAKSEYLSYHDLSSCVAEDGRLLFQDGRTLILKEEGAFPKGRNSVQLEVVPAGETFNSSDFLVTVPGTCTAEAMFLGLPMIVVAPYISADSIPLGGAASFIDTFVPSLGRVVKKELLNAKINSCRFLSYPNLKAERKIVPEMRGRLEPAQVAETVSQMANDAAWREQIGKQLKDLRESPAAAAAIVDYLTTFFLRTLEDRQ